MAKLGAICELVNGYAFKPTDWSEKGLPIIRIQNLNDNNAPFNYYNGEIDDKYYVKDGDLLFAWSGTPGTSFGAFFWKRGKGILNQHIFNVYPVESINKEYFRYALNGNLDMIISKAHGGVGLKHITKKELENIDIPLPPFETQKQIAANLDKVTHTIDLCNNILVKLDLLVKSRFIELFGDYRINEKGFDCKKGSELFKFSSGKFLPEEKRLDEGVPVYGGNGIAWYTSECLIDYPTIIIGRVGAQCGNIHAVTTPVWITDNAIYIKDQKTKAYTLEFLTELMRMMDFYQYADFSGQPKITQKPLETLDYIMPPIELQNKYTSFVEQTDKSKSAVKQVLEKAETLKKALMQEYFG